MTRDAPLSPGKLVVGGCPEGFDARHLARTIARADGPVIHVARDDARLSALRAALRFFAPDLPALTLPAWDCLPYDRISTIRTSPPPAWRRSRPSPRASTGRRRS